MSCRILSIGVSVTIVLVATFARAQQFTEPSKILPPAARKTTVSGTAVTIQPNESVPQSTGQTKVEFLGPAAPSPVSYGTPDAASLSARQTAPQEAPLL